MRLPLGALVLIAAATLVPSPVSRAAGPASASLFVGAPEVVGDKGGVAVLVGAARVDGTPAKVEEPHLLLDGKEAGPATSREGLAEYAAEHPKWTPPMAVGVVYLWAKGTPEAVIDGVESLLKRLPSRTTIYPTPYGQGYRPVITRLTAGRAAGGELRDTPAIEGDQVKLIEAIRFNARKLAEDTAPLKHLIIVTDGRDYEAGRDPHAFAAAGDELRKRKLRVGIVWFRSGTDAPENVTGMRELVEAARARQVSADRVGDLPAIVESLSDGLISLERVQFAVPWGKRMFGGKPKVGVRALVDGAVVTGVDGTVSLPGGAGILFVIGGLVLLVGVAGVGIWLWRRKSGGLTPLLDELQNLVRMGVPPEQAVVDLSQSFPSMVKKLVAVDVAKLPPDRYRTLRTRAGKARVRDIQKLLSTEESAIDDDMAEVLARAASEGADAREAARRLRAKVGGDKWSALARADQKELKRSLESAGKAHGGLASAKAVGFAAQVQEALRGQEAKAVGVAWLVRVSGAGARGETLRIPVGGGFIGRGATCAVRTFEDTSISEQHAQVLEAQGEYQIRPAGGLVFVEGQPIAAERALADGETVTLGGSRFIFKCATAR